LALQPEDAEAPRIRQLLAVIRSPSESKMYCFGSTLLPACLRSKCCAPSLVPNSIIGRLLIALECFSIVVARDD
jgi:hypothetical protein